MSEIVATAFHESGHALAVVLAFRNAAWLPRPAPPLLVRYLEITEHSPGQWGGCCVSPDVYSMKLPVYLIAPRYRPLMEAQLVIHLAGGISEAIYRGERDKREVLAFAESNCAMDDDLSKAADVLGDLRRLTGYRFEPRDFVGQTLAMLLANWPAVTALAAALVEHRRIEGEDVEAIIDHSMIESAS